MNKVCLIGRLTKDPELRYTTNGTAIANFTLAVNRPFTNQKGNKEADFIPIVVWNKAAENCAQYLAKGQQTAIEGRLQVRSYEDNDKQKRWITEVIAERVEFLGSKSNSNNTNSYSNDLSLGEEVAFSESEIPF